MLFQPFLNMENETSYNHLIQLNFLSLIFALILDNILLRLVDNITEKVFHQQLDIMNLRFIFFT